MIETVRNKMLGCLYGQAIGDAFGLGTEFMDKSDIRRYYPEGLSRYDQFVQDAHRKQWNPGEWTDDTDMMICIMTAFENGEFNVNKVARNFKDWFKSDPKDIGSNTYKVLCLGDYLQHPETCARICWEVSGKRSAANGALMRTSVVGLLPDKVDGDENIVEGYNVTKQSEKICKLTHYDPRCVGSCVIASLIIHNLVWHDKTLSYEEIKAIGDKYDDRIGEWIDIAYTSSDISALNLDEPGSIGYTLRTLAAALWCFWHASSFESGLKAVVNEGGDADTNGAVAGAILGAKFGFDSIPEYYIDNLYNNHNFREMAESFIKKSLDSNSLLKK